MKNSHKLDFVLNLIEDMIGNYQKMENKEIKEFIINLKDFLSNPLSLQKNAYDLAYEFNNLGINTQNSKNIWNEVESFIEKKYRAKKKEETFSFQEKLRDYEQILINFIIDIGKSKGTNETLSAIIGYLLIHTYLTQSQLQTLSGFSRGAISENLKRLVDIGFAKKERVEESKTYRYSIGENWRYIAQNVSFVKTTGVEKMKDFIQQKYQKLNTTENKSKKGSSILSKRLMDLNKFFRMYQTIIQQINKSPMIKNLTQNEDKQL